MRRKNTQMTTNILICSLLLIGVVYALLQSNLQINGLAKILNNTWDVHFDNVQVSEGSVSIGTGDSPATIDENNNCKVDFEVTLSLPGDFYEFTIDVVNAGTIDGMIGKLNKTLIINNEVIQEPLDYLNYSVTYDDGVELEEHHKLSAGTVETYKVRLEYKTDIEELPQTTTISTSLEPQFIQADSSAVEVLHPNRLYNVLKEAAVSGQAAQYTGAHHDSFVLEPSQNIYYWTPTNSNASSIHNKDNVIFANHCWQMIRTTDTGGVKLLYNGEVENNQCLDSRQNHVGYKTRTTKTLSSNYWYGTDYIYDSTTQKFSISGITEQVTWNDLTYSGLIGKYTCISTVKNESCSTFYKIDYYKNSSTAYVLSLDSSSHYSQFGTLPFYQLSSSPTYVGYMYGDTYTYKTVETTSSMTWSTNANLFATFSEPFSPTSKYSKTINDTGSNYELVNPILGSDIPEDSYAGYYTFNSDTIVSGTQPYYVVGLDYGTNYYYVSLSATKKLSDFYIKIGDSLIENLDGTYTLDGITTVSPTNWYTNYQNYNNKYTCASATTVTCENPRYLTSTSKNIYNYWSLQNKIVVGKTLNGTNLEDTLLLRRDEMISHSDYKYTCNTDSASCNFNNIKMITSFNYYGFNYIENRYYGSSVTWDGEKYTLVDPIGLENYNNLDNISTHHYTCINQEKTCQTVAYLFYYTYYGNKYYYITLSNGVLTSEKALEDMFTKNTTNSTIKKEIDSWYQRYLLKGYDNYIEDTVFCNDRSIKQLGGWDANGGNLQKVLNFKNSSITTDLSCLNVTDRFSISNTGAQLTYKVGLMSAPEMQLLNSTNFRKTGIAYWLISPNFYDDVNSNISCVNENGSILRTANTVLGVRPAISLIPRIKYTEGDGSKEHPYIIETN